MTLANDKKQLQHYYVGLILPNLISNPEFSHLTSEDMVRKAVKMADLLVKELEKPHD